MQGIDEVALAFDAACRAADVDYAFMGAMAVMVWGEPRATTDIDALVTLPATKIDALVAQLRARGLDLDPRDLHDALRGEGHVSIFPKDGVFWVDVKLAITQEERAEVAHAAEAPVRGASLRIVGAEETVAFKLKFGTPKDLQDAGSIVVRQAGKLDAAKLRAIASRLGVVAALDDLLARTSHE